VGLREEYMKNIVIINAYGKKNIGDATILYVALEMLNSVLDRGVGINLMLVDKDSYSLKLKIFQKVSFFQSPYGYAIKSAKLPVSQLVKIVRFFIIYILSTTYIFLGKFSGRLFPNKGFYSYITSIYQSEIVISMGGGYLTTKNKVRDYFGLLLSLLPIYIAKFYKKRILFLPMSFGPFVSKYHQSLTYNAAKNTTILCRDDIALKEVKKLFSNDKTTKVLYCPDLALFYSSKKKSNLHQKFGSNYIVLTAREWLPDAKQIQFEESLAKFIDFIAMKYNLNTIFIPMAWNHIEDDDNRVAKRIKTFVKSTNSFTIVNAKSPIEVQEILRNAKLAICTRMHSAILATTVNTPFIAIGYVYKTLGFVQKMNLEKYYMDIAEVSYEKLIKEFSNIINPKNYQKVYSQLIEKNQEIHIYKKLIREEIRKVINNT